MVHYRKIWMGRVLGLCDFASPRTFVKTTTPIQIFCGSNIPNKNAKSIGEIPKMLWKHNCLNQYFQMFDHFGIKVGVSYCHMPSIKKDAQELVCGTKKDQNWWRHQSFNYEVSLQICPSSKSCCKLTSGSMWIKDVAKRTPPPKQSKTEVKVRFHILSSLKKYLPIFRGKNPIIRDTIARSDIAIIFVVMTSIFLSKWNRV